jgi:RimJ/RimL family protein N-acetyltransferase
MEAPNLDIGPLSLRQLVPEDAELLEPYFNDPLLIRLLGLPGPRDVPFLRSLIMSARRDPCALYVAIDLEGATVGYTFLDQIDWGHRHATEIGVMVGPSYLWDKGVGRAAFGRILLYGFDDLSLHRASLGVLEENVRAIRSYEALGFKREGMRRESLLLDTEWVDTVMMGVLAPEFNRIAVAEAEERLQFVIRPRG